MLRLVRRLIVPLLLLLQVVGMLGRGGLTWRCEGRVCSTDSARCCCEAAIGARDASCLRDGTLRPSAGCAGKCACQAVFTAKSVAVVSNPHGIAPETIAEPVLLPTPFRVVDTLGFVALRSPSVRPIPPPEREPESLVRGSLALRAPPVPFA